MLCLIIIIVIIINFSQKTRVTQKAGPANMLPKKTSSVSDQLSTSTYCRPREYITSTARVCVHMRTFTEIKMARKRRKKAHKSSRDSTLQPANNRPKKLRQWNEDSMRRAYEAVTNKEMGVNRAALEFKVPRTTLKDRVSLRVIHGCNMGPKPYLTQEEEKELVDFVLNCSKLGYGKTKQDVLQIVHSTLVKKGTSKADKVSHGWWIRFCKRWPQLRLRKGDSFPVVRDQMTNSTVFKDYFDLLDKTLSEYGIKDKPAQIYNCDESGMPLEFKMPKVIAAKGTKKVRQCSSGSKTQITILACASASGQAIPPMVVFAGKNFNSILSKGEVPATLYGMSSSGWMDQELFADWFLHHFLVHAVASRPLLLLLDGHSSHYTLELVKLAAEHDVILFCLPPHTTADTQPLDTSCFKPLKNYWVDVCRKYLFTNPSRVITKFQFSGLFAEAWSKGMTVSNITSGFRTTGVYPFDPNAVLDKLSDSRASTSASSKKIVLSPQLLKKYERRYENGYNIFTDKGYVQWLRDFHPNDLPPGTYVA